MSINEKQRRWGLIAGWVLCVGVLIHLILFLGVRIRLGTGPDLEQKVPFVSYENETEERDSVLLERAILFDSEPLFVPTKWNSASDLSEVARLKDETELFEFYDAVIHLKSEAIAGVSGGWLSERKSSVKPVDRLKKIMPPVMESLGARADSRGGLASRGAWVEVFSMGSDAGRITYNDEIGLDEIEVPQLWSPMVYYLIVDSELGFLPPLRTNSSGDEALDDRIMDHLGSEAFRRKVGDGYFRVEVGP